VPDQGADLLDEVEQWGAFLAGQGLAEETAEAADVGSEGGIGAVMIMLVGHRALLRLSTEDGAVRHRGSYPCRLVDANESMP